MWGNCSMTCQHAKDRIFRCARFVLNVNDAELIRNVFSITNSCSLSHCVLIFNVSTVFKSNKIEASIACLKCDDHCFFIGWTCILEQI